MIPLKQWICDTCGELIPLPEAGYVEWLDDGAELGARDFYVVHHGPASPKHPQGHCYQHEDHKDRRDLPVDRFLGDAGLSYLLSFLDHGKEFDPKGKHPPRVKGGNREWVELVRRLHLPYFEEARQYFNEAKADGMIGDYGPDQFYDAEILKGVIKQYRKQRDR